MSPTTILALAALCLTQATPTPLTWRSALELRVEGRGWEDTRAPYDRLPDRAMALVREPVWNLSRDSAGMAVRFDSDASEIHVRWKLNSSSLQMRHMPSSGVSGLDLYVRTEDGWRWLAVGFPEAQENEARLVADLPAGRREYRLYLPLYNGVSSLEIGVPEGRTLVAGEPEPGKPLVFYGTSITQGACASRPGMCHTALLGRMLGREVINLGFSGNGRLDAELAPLIGELDASVFVIDCLPNLQADAIRERLEPFVRTLRAARPDTPIVLVEDRTYPQGFLLAARRERNDASRSALREGYDALVADGVSGLYYLDGDPLLGDDGDATVDGSHPNDLGFARQAEHFRPLLAQLLAAEGR